MKKYNIFNNKQKQTPNREFLKTKAAKKRFF